MKTSIVLPFIAAVLLAVVGSTSLHRDKRQVWGFPDDQVTTGTSARPPPTPTTTTSTSASSSSTTTTARPGVSTSTQPTGVIFQVPNCNCPAPPQFNPVCGTDGNTYANPQKLGCARQCGYDVQQARLGSC